MINIVDFWEDAKDELSKSMLAISFEIWISKLEPVCFVENMLVLSTITSTAKKTIDEKFLDQIQEVVKKLNPAIEDVIVILPNQKQSYLDKQTVFIENQGFVTMSGAEKSNVKKSPFLERYTFENFVEGGSNSYALSACKIVASNPGNQYNPLFIYSGVGLGKTHLLHAIGNYLYKESPKTKVLYVSTDTFVNDYMSMIKSQTNETTNTFREKYRLCDVLMVDDIQSLVKKEAIQQAFFNIFNDLYNSNKQIIIASDRPPKELNVLEERLRTRFSWGLTVDINVPDMETRIAILHKKAANMKFALSDEVAEYIAESCTSNIRDLEGMLNNIVYFSSLSGKMITTRDLAMEALKDQTEKNKDTIDESDIIGAVCKIYGTTTEDLFSKKRTKNIVEPRMVAIYLITELLSMPLSKIGEMFGGRDHTTIIHARDTITDELKTNTLLRIKVADIKNLLLNR